MWQGGRPPFGFDLSDRRLIANEKDVPYTPVFTNKKSGKRYSYYTNKALAEDRNHPNYERAQFPA